MDAEELNQRLYAGRMSRRTLADTLGVSHTSVNRWCAGEVPIPQARVEQIEECTPPVQSEPAV